MNPGNLLFTFKGRINRAKYWLALVIWCVVWAAVLGAGFGGEMGAGFGGEMIAGNAGAILIVIILLLLVTSGVSGVAVGIKRLHDRDKSGWWLLIFYLLPAVFDGIGRGGVPALSLVAFAISIWSFVELGCLRGTDGPNTYGPDPLEAGEEQPA
ncbi:MAG: hypothetical protein QOK01_2614 [Alphaproteobacteria bacterium]|jgi:uncharacterized membrane protein YhaH (DUF805 family)|nr:hypothetical protein [Alphaproteobacteria bacterium]